MFLSACFKYCSPGLPAAFSPNIAPSRMFTTNSLCPSVCPIHKLCLLFKFLKVIFLLSPYENLHHSFFYLSILSLTFFSSSMFQMPFKIHRVGCRTVMWKERRNQQVMIRKRNHQVMIWKQQPNSHINTKNIKFKLWILTPTTILITMMCQENSHPKKMLKYAFLY